MSLLGTIGGLIGLAVGGPAGAAIGSGIGTLAGGGDAEDAIKAGILGYGIGSIPGVQNFAASAGATIGLGGVGQNQAMAAAAQGSQGQKVAQALFGTGAAAVPGEKAADVEKAAGIGGGGGITGILNNPYVMAGILQGLDKATADTDVLTDLQRRQIETGERMPDYKGRSIFDARAQNQAKFVDSATGLPRRRSNSGCNCGITSTPPAAAGLMRASRSSNFSLGIVMLDVPMLRTRPWSTNCSSLRQTFM